MSAFGMSFAVETPSNNPRVAVGALLREEVLFDCSELLAYIKVAAESSVCIMGVL